MPRYYFHLHGRQNRLEDDEGVVLPDSEAAWYQAIRSGREVIRGELQLGLRFEEQVIEIVDEGGAPVEHIPLAEIASYAL
ncbi:MAG: hypothetical protein JOZ90_07415 [Alphaproteobacteria bacterium]|nr:hypothetical protein [Alphaproteobacteria bacterium]MBV9372740.1 hypothetical protein [Alphaproteobacteria bacterium]MBV9900911.1 hypothetical protein [Alphaproteobacteria bacterium]